MTELTPGLRRPVSAGSWFARRPDRPYTEVGGHSMVLVPERRMAYEIAPGARGLWAALGDRPLGELVAALDPDRPPLEYVELVRRWRALGLVEERAVLAAQRRAANDQPTSVAGSSLTWRRLESAGAAVPAGDDALEWFSVLLRWVADDDLHRPGLADAIAEMAEQPDLCTALAARLCDLRG